VKASTRKYERERGSNFFDRREESPEVRKVRTADGAENEQMTFCRERGVREEGFLCGRKSEWEPSFLPCRACDLTSFLVVGGVCMRLGVTHHRVKQSKSDYLNQPTYKKRRLMYSTQ
jgi:hypothetical protein